MPDREPDRSFLEGSAIAVRPGSILSTLAELWGPAADQTPGDEAQPAVTRISLGTLVVVTTAAREAEVGRLWQQLSEEHPSRAVMAVVDERTDGLSAAVAAACHVAGAGGPQVCSERIALRLSPDRLDRLAGTILPLLEPDVPATFWWDLPTAPPTVLAEQMGRVLDRCLTDLTHAEEPAAVWRALGECGCQPLSDLAWYRAGRWREGTARLFDGVTDRASLEAIERIEVVGAAAAEGQLLPAALLGGWVADRLGWTPLAHTDSAELGLGDMQVVRRTNWRRPGGTGELLIATVAVGDGRPGRLQELCLSAPAEHASWTLERLHSHPRELRVEAHHTAWCQLPTRLPAPRPSRLELLLNVLTTPPHNAMRERSLANAAWILGWQNQETSISR